MIKDLKQAVNYLEHADKIINEITENNDYISFEVFEKITMIVSDLLKCTYYADTIKKSLEIIPDDLYVNLIVLHNSAVDFVTSYEKFKKDTEVE